MCHSSDTESVQADEPFTLANDPPRKPVATFDDQEKTRQTVLIEGLDCLPGQLDLF